MSLQERQKQINAAQAIMHQEMLDRQILHSCLNCESWDGKTEMCTHYKSKPPISTIMFSCGEQWLGEIPF